jgi:hypothetical protein
LCLQDGQAGTKHAYSQAASSQVKVRIQQIHEDIQEQQTLWGGGKKSGF